MDEVDVRMSDAVIGDLVAAVERVVLNLHRAWPGDLTLREKILSQGIKVAEETGELSEAITGMYGLNPRKGFSNTETDALKEVVDVVCTALGIAELITPGCLRRLLADRVRFLADRSDDFPAGQP